MRNIKRFIILLVLVCGLLSGGTSVFAHGGEHDELIIRMTKEGFEPNELTVWEGDEVIFINNDDVDRWPASDFHPTHNLYPEFDSLGGVPPGGSWTMKFESIGTWRMHDHLIPHMRGMIVVLEDPEKIVVEEVSKVENSRGILSRIKSFFASLWQKVSGKSTQRESKLLNEFKSLDEKDKYAWLEERARIEGPEIAWQYVLKAYNTPEGVVGNPHDMAHLVGHLIYDKYGFEGIDICDPSFAFGCYHGLMEVALYDGDGKTYEERLLEAEKGCGAVGSNESPSYWSCIHGIGHGVATYRDYDLSPSLDDCDLLEKRVRTYCHDGVFMEFSISAPPSFYTRENPIYPCDVVGESYQTACARSQTYVMRNRLNLDNKTIAEKCLATNNERIIYHCVDSIGFFAAQSQNVSNISNICQQIAQRERVTQCLAAAAGELVFQNSANWQTMSLEICNSIELENRNICLERVEGTKKSYGRN